MTVRDRTRALKDAARDVCPMCDGRSRGVARLTGPNAAGNYVHGDLLCPASAIWARLKYETVIGGMMPDHRRDYAVEGEP